MVAPTSPVRSPGVERLIELARESSGVLYVVAIGCLTNVASALLIAPDIVDKIVVIWTAGYPSTDPRSNQPALNLVQDPHAVRVVLDSGVPYIYMPGYTVGQQLTVSQPEMHAWVKGAGPLGDLLADLYDNNPLHRMLGIGDHFGRTWVIWDLICLAWLIDPALVTTTLRPTPGLATDLRWDMSHSDGRHLMREAIGVDRDGIFRDLFSKLKR
jgi:inosine-uridine nucleoside N-ribohydrolase